MKTFRQRLYERQLKFYYRALFLPKCRWVHQALLEHLSGSWTSNYLGYIASVRSKIGAFSSSLNLNWMNLLNDFFITATNKTLTGLDCVLPVKKFARLTYVSESEWSSVITQFKFANEELGNKQPLKGLPRKHYCPVCPVLVCSSGLHLLLVCSSVAKLRSECGILTFMTQCALMDRSLLETYVLYVSGMSPSKSQITQQDYLERGRCIHDMRKFWLSKWVPK